MSIRNTALAGAVSVERRQPYGEIVVHVNARNLTISEAEQLGALLGAEARAARARRRRSRPLLDA